MCFDTKGRYIENRRRSRSGLCRFRVRPNYQSRPFLYRSFHRLGNLGVALARLWKFTDENDRTYGGCQWGEGVEHTASGRGGLCGPGWIHAYTDPLLAVFLNPVHGDFDSESYHLWEAEGDVGKTDHGLKVGCARIRAIRRVDIPEVTTKQRIRFGVLCAMRVCKDKAWRTWAEKWLSGEDRSEKVAWVAAGAAGAARATASAAAEAAAVWPARTAAWATARAASAAAEEAGTPLPLAEIAREAVSEEV